MDKETIKQNIYDFFIKLPKDGQDYFSSLEWLESIKKISEKYKLATDETEGIAIETMLFLLGMITLKEYEIEVVVSLRQDDDVVEEKIIKELKDLVASRFGEEKLQSFYLKNSTAQTNQQTNKQTGERKVSTINTEEAIKRSGWQEKLLEISQKNNLNIEQSGVLEDVVVKTMKNEISSEKFFSEVTSLVTKDSEKATNITKEVNEQIFQEIRTLMMEGEGREEEVKETIEEKIPLPPYANNEKPKEEEKKTTEVKSNEVKRLQEILDSENKNASFGGIKNVDYNVPKTFSNTKPSGVEQPQIVTTKPHDPYREII